MKIVKQNDFQKLYKDPDREKTDEMRRTLSALPERKERTVFRKYRVAFILAAVLLFTGIAGVAVTKGSKIWLSWNGEQTIYDTHPIQEDDENWTEEKQVTMDDLLWEAPRDMMTVVRWVEGMGASSTDMAIEMEEKEQLLETLDAAGYPRPMNLLDNCEFRRGHVYYGCAPGGEYKQVSQKVVNGIEQTQYTIDPEYRVITGYSVSVKKGDRKFSVSSKLVGNVDSAIGIELNSRGEIVSVPGMEKAMYIVRKDGTSFLDMCRSLNDTVTVRAQPPYGNGYYSPDKTFTYRYEMFEIMNMTPEEAAEFFAE